MLDRSKLLIFMCAAAVLCSNAPSADADWSGPIVVPQQPQVSQLPLQQPPTLSRDALTPTLQPLPSAPQVTTENGKVGSGVERENDDAVGGLSNDGPGQRSDANSETSLPSVSQSDQTGADLASDSNENSQLPESEPSKSKIPWFLAAGVAFAAFMLGRRTRKVGRGNN